jgi:hypothetical protein
MREPARANPIGFLYVPLLLAFLGASRAAAAQTAGESQAPSSNGMAPGERPASAAALAVPQGLASLEAAEPSVATRAAGAAPGDAAAAVGQASRHAKHDREMGRVVGRLTDVVTGEPLVGGQVSVQGLALGNISDDAGAYFINNVPLGKRTFTVEYLGYVPQSKEHSVQPGNSNTLDFALDPTPITGEEVVVEEEFVADLSGEIEKTAAPAFRPVALREVAITKPDTTQMEEWHRSWKGEPTIFSIEYPMMGESVYFRRPPSKPSP